MKTTSSLLDRVEGLQTTGTNCWRAKCPGHKGKSRSLSIKRVDDRWLLHCFAGCDPIDVLSSIGLSLSDLFDECVNAKPLPHQYRIQKNARTTLEAIEVPLTVMLIAISTLRERPLTQDELEEVNEAYDTIVQALAKAGIEPAVIQDAKKELRYGTR